MEKDLSGAEGHWVPECVRAYLRGAGYSTRALEDIEPHVRECVSASLRLAASAS